VLGIEGERQVAMEADHSRIRKFTGPNDPLYIKVSKCIQRLAKAAPDAVAAKFKVENLIRMLKLTFHSSYRLLPDFQFPRVAEILPRIRLSFARMVQSICELAALLLLSTLTANKLFLKIKAVCEARWTSKGTSGLCFATFCLFISVVPSVILLTLTFFYLPYLSLNFSFLNLKSPNTNVRGDNYAT
jgi:hypothetical protein